MKRTSLSLVLLCVLFSVCACVAKAEPVRILGIGNSFTVDALEQHFQPLLTAEGKEAIIGYPYRGGTFLSQHDAWSQRTDTLPYNYRVVLARSRSSFTCAAHLYIHPRQMSSDSTGGEE